MARTGLAKRAFWAKRITVLEFLRDTQHHFIGHDVYDIEDLYRRFTLLDFGVPGEVVMTGLALVEMACWDCIGKLTHQPVYNLIGGKVVSRVPAYANGWVHCGAVARGIRRSSAKGGGPRLHRLEIRSVGNGNLELTRDEFFRSIDLIEAVPWRSG